MLRQILRASVTLTVSILLGRLAGVVREVAIAARLGTTDGAGLAVILLTLPDLLSGLLVGAAASAVLVPEFKRIRATTKQPGIAFFWQATAVVTLVSGFVAVILALAAPVVAKLLAPGYDPHLLANLATLMPMAAPAIPLTAAAAVSNALLQAEGRFAAGALGTLIFNVVIALATVTLIDQSHLEALPLAITAAALVRWLVQIVVLARLLPLLRKVGRRQSKASLLLRSYGQALVAAVSLLLVPPIGRAMVSFGGPSDVATFAYAQKLIELPLGTLGTVTSIAALPFMAQLSAERKEDEAGVLGRRLTLITWLTTVGPGLAFALAAQPIAQLILLHGSMSTEATRQVGGLAAIGGIALPAYALASLFTSMLFARGDNAPVMWSTFGAVGFFLATAPFALTYGGVAAIMVCVVAVQVLVAGGCVVALHRRHGITVFSRDLTTDLFKILITAAVMSALAASVTPLGTAAAVATAGILGALCIAIPFAYPMRTMNNQSLMNLGLHWRRLRLRDADGTSPGST